MSPDVLPLLGTVLAAALGGGTVTGVLTYVRERRRDRGEQAVGAVGSLERLNDRLTAQVAELQTALDRERQQRRALEDLVDAERRQWRQERGELSLRIALLERHVAADEEEGT